MRSPGKMDCIGFFNRSETLWLGDFLLNRRLGLEVVVQSLGVRVNTVCVWVRLPFSVSATLDTCRSRAEVQPTVGVQEDEFVLAPSIALGKLLSPRT